MTPTPECIEAVARALLCHFMGIKEDNGLVDMGEVGGAFQPAAAAAIVAYEAARQPQPQPTDDELARIFWKEYSGAERERSVSKWTLAGIRAVRAALTAPVPQVQIPDGWFLWQVFNRYETDYAATIYSGVMGEESYQSRTGFGPTWQEALAAACEKAGGTDE